LALAHPFHTTTAEIEINSQTGRYEVTLKVLAADLEEALTSQQSAANSPGKRSHIDLQATPQIERLITAYVNQHFYITRHQPSADASVETQAAAEPTPKSTMRWVGFEVQKAWAWVYFEIDPVGTGPELRLTNTVLCEMNAGQINTCVLRDQAQKTSLKTSAQNPTAVMNLSASKR
jgi:hypothetical protein